MLKIISFLLKQYRLERLEKKGARLTRQRARILSKQRRNTEKAEAAREAMRKDTSVVVRPSGVKAR